MGIAIIFVTPAQFVRQTIGGPLGWHYLARA
jgi:hypothetical protein